MGIIAGAIPSAISGTIMQQAMANGLKMSDDLARLSYGVGETLFGTKEKYIEHQEKRQLFQRKIANMDSITRSRSLLNSQRREHSVLNGAVMPMLHEAGVDIKGYDLSDQRVVKKLNNLADTYMSNKAKGTKETNKVSNAMRTYKERQANPLFNKHLLKQECIKSGIFDKECWEGNPSTTAKSKEESQPLYKKYQ